MAGDELSEPSLGNVVCQCRPPLWLIVTRPPLPLLLTRTRSTGLQHWNPVLKIATFESVSPPVDEYCQLTVPWIERLTTRSWNAW